MRIFEAPGTIKRYRRTTWEFPQTFQTPLEELPRFVEIIISAIPEIESAQAVFDQIIFEPRYGLVSLGEKYSLAPTWDGEDLTIEAQGVTEARDLLQAVLSEWIDFFFVPTPKRFVIYADHDEYITFFAHRKGQLTNVVEVLRAAKFRAVDYVRRF